jgi:anti-sigma regulatory factor (Ser/Thr protein kinase)
MDIRLSLELPEDVAHVSMVRRISREVLRSYNASVQDIDDIETLVGELVTNAVRHAHASRYRILLDLSGDRVVVSVVDDGVGFTREQVPPPGTSRLDAEGGERIGGWGLPLIEMLADSVQFFPNDPHGTTVRAEKRLQLQTQ